MSYSAHAVQWEGKGDNNRGLIYGIEYMDGDEVADVEWFKSARIRDGNLKLYLDDLKTWDKTFNADESMSPAEFAKLMGAYPEPAGNPLPAYGGYMDNSAANFSWVQNNDYFGAEGDGLLHKPRCGWDECEGSEWCIHDSYDNCEQCGERKGLHDLFGEVGTCDDCLIPKRHDGEKYKTVLGTCVVCRGEDGDRGCDFCDLAYCDSGCFEEHIEDGEGDGRNCDMEHIKGKEGWGAESDGDLCDVCETNKLLFEMTDMAANEVLCQSCIQDGHDSHWTIKTHIPETFPVDSEAYKTPKTEVGYTVGNGAESFENHNPKCIYMTNPITGSWVGWPSIKSKGQTDCYDLGYDMCESCSYFYIKKDSQEAESFNAEGVHHDGGRSDGGKFLSNCCDGDITTMDGKKWKCMKCNSPLEVNVEELEEWYGAESESNSCDACQKDKPIVAHVEFDGPFLSALCKECYAEHLEMGGKPSVYGAETFEARAETTGRPTRLVVAIDTSGSTGMDYKGRGHGGFGKDNRLGQYPLLKKYETMARQMAKTMDTDEFIILDWNGQGVTHGPRHGGDSLTAYNGTGSIGMIGEWLQEHKVLADGEYIDTVVIITDGIVREFLYKNAEMDIVADGMAVVSNIRDDVVGVVEVIDDEDDDEMVEISIQDENMEEIGSYTLDDGMILDDEDNYLAESKTPSLLTLGIGAIAAIFAFPYLKEGVNKVFSADNDIQENEPELIENPDIGDLDPAQYEELVVESTGYALDIIPMGLDGSFMGSRFAALPTERYVDYNDPGIGAHTDIALNRDETFLEPEMAMVQAAEGDTVVKETQAPGQSPYLSIDGQEPVDMNYRVIKETHPVSLDPAVKPFIPQSMAGYTGNKNTPPSVYNKMFNIGVLGQTPLFTPQDAGDIGASRAGSRRATPNTLGLNGSVGGPLSDKVNANYTDGTTSMSLAQWAIENTVSQSSDTEAVVIDRSSGAMKRVRRV